MATSKCFMNNFPRCCSSNASVSITNLLTVDEYVVFFLSVSASALEKLINSRRPGCRLRLNGEKCPCVYVPCCVAAVVCREMRLSFECPSWWAFRPVMFHLMLMTWGGFGEAPPSQRTPSSELHSCLITTIFTNPGSDSLCEQPLWFLLARG